MCKFKIYYIGYHIKDDNPNEFFHYPSASNKMGYFIKVLKEIRKEIFIYSLGESYSFHLPKYKKIDDIEEIKYVGTVGKKNILLSLIARLYLLLQLFIFLVFKVKKNSIVIVYHTYNITSVVRLSRIFNQFKLVYEIEEIYNAAWRKTEKEIQKEIKSLNFADAYIFVNDLMEDKFGFSSTLNAVCYGEYNHRVNLKLKKNKEEYVLVYAGVIGDRNSDIYLSIDTINYLPNNFILKIVGYGIEEDIKNMEMYINNLNVNYPFKRIFYDGKLSGEEYLDYLSKCDVGLCTRVLENYYSDYTFPSKVLVYLSNNLHVISSDITCIIKSKVAQSINFYNSQTPESVAKAILDIDFNMPVSSKIMKNLHEKFRNDLEFILNNI